MFERGWQGASGCGILPAHPNTGHLYSGVSPKNILGKIWNQFWKEFCKEFLPLLKIY